MDEKLKKLNKEIDEEYKDIEIPAMIKETLKNFFKDPDLITVDQCRMLSSYFDSIVVDKLKNKKEKAIVVDVNKEENNIDESNKIPTDSDIGEIIN